MKKSLYMTTALAAASVLALGATDATAAEMKAKKMSVGVSGSFKSLVGFAKQGGSFESTSNGTSRTGYDAINMINDSEVHVKGTTKLDNGIAVSVVVQFETDVVNNGSQIDESYVKLTGGFGDVRLGNTKNSSFTLKHSGPLPGAIGLENPDSNAWVVRPAALSTLSNAIVSTHHGAGDAMRIVYYTPKFNGFRAGASYTPSNTSSADTPAAVGGNGGVESQSFDAVVAYENKLGSTDVKADIGYAETYGNAASSTRGWRGGLSLGFGAITVGGSYKEVEDTDTTSTAKAHDAFGAGIQYASGPMKIGAKYFKIATDQSAAVAGSDEGTKIALGGSYTMGPGVDLVGTIVHVDWADELSTDGNNNDGWAAIGGIKVSF